MDNFPVIVLSKPGYYFAFSAVALSVALASHFSPLIGFDFSENKSSHAVTVLAYNFVISSVVVVFYVLCWMFFGEQKRGTAQHQVLEQLLTFLMFKLILIEYVLQTTLLEVSTWVFWFAIFSVSKGLVYHGHMRAALLASSGSPWHHYVRPALHIPIVLGTLFGALLLAWRWSEASNRLWLLLLYDIGTLYIEWIHVAAVYALYMGEAGMWAFIPRVRVESLNVADVTYILDSLSDVLLRSLALLHFIHIGTINGISLSLIDVVLLLNTRAIAVELWGKTNELYQYWTIKQRMDELFVTENNPSNTEVCPICIQDFTSCAKRLPCGHLLHSPCLGVLIQKQAQPYTGPLPHDSDGTTNNVNTAGSSAHGWSQALLHRINPGSTVSGRGASLPLLSVRCPICRKNICVTTGSLISSDQQDDSDCTSNDNDSSLLASGVSDDAVSDTILARSSGEESLGTTGDIRVDHPQAPVSSFPLFFMRMAMEIVSMSSGRRTAWRRRNRDDLRVDSRRQELSPSSLETAVDQVIAVFPQFPRDMIARDLRQTESVDGTIENILAGRIQWNHRMHPLNPYKDNRPDFAELSRLYPDVMRKHVIVFNNGEACLNWRDPESQRALTEVLLHRDFNLRVSLPHDKLCPPLPNRLNYICWLSDLFTSGKDWTTSVTNASWERPHILDIGTGASCIYPLLGNRFLGWKFTGSDIDVHSLEWAQGILRENSIPESDIALVLVGGSKSLQQSFREWLSNTQPLLQCLQSSNTAGVCEAMRGPVRQALVSMGGIYAQTVLWCENVVLSHGPVDNGEIPPTVLTGCMTNPPFYSLQEQIEESPLAVCTGSSTEMATEGGEVAFVLGILADSLILRDRVEWYSSMLGKRSSLRHLLRALRSEGVSRIYSTRFIQGSTVRWGIAWTFLAPGPGEDPLRHHKVFGAKKAASRRPVSSELCTLSVEHMVRTALIGERRYAALATEEEGWGAGPWSEDSILEFLRCTEWGAGGRVPAPWVTPPGVLMLSLLRVVSAHCVRVDGGEGRVYGWKHVSEPCENDEDCVGIDVTLRLSCSTQQPSCAVLTIVTHTEDCCRDYVNCSEDVNEQSSKRRRPAEAKNSNVDGPVVSFSIELKCDAADSTSPSGTAEERKLFFKLFDLLKADILRTNRRWRRILGKS